MVSKRVERKVAWMVFYSADQKVDQMDLYLVVTMGLQMVGLRVDALAAKKVDTMDSRMVCGMAVMMAGSKAGRMVAMMDIPMAVMKVSLTVLTRVV